MTHTLQVLNWWDADVILQSWQGTDDQHANIIRETTLLNEIEFTFHLYRVDSDMTEIAYCLFYFYFMFLLYAHRYPLKFFKTSFTCLCSWTVAIFANCGLCSQIMLYVVEEKRLKKSFVIYWITFYEVL